MRPGTIGLNKGAMVAASGRVTIEITGRGGHGAHRCQNADPVLAAAHTITALQSVVSRNIRAIDSGVVSICAMQAGDPAAMGVTPNKATLVGTARTFNPAVQELIEGRITALCSAVTPGFGATASVKYQRLYPLTIDTPAEALFMVRVAEGLVGSSQWVRDLDPGMDSEDFSFMLQVKPGAYMRVGQGAESGPGSCTLHNSRYDFNDAILPLGAAMHASLTKQFILLL